MTTMVSELYEALREAGASKEQAAKAAEAVAAYDNRFNKIEVDLTVLKWMVGAVLAGVVTLILKSFFI
jgi:hypothetical protein